MAFTIFLCLAGASYCVFMNSPAHVRRFEYIAIGGTVLLGAASAIGTAAGWSASPLVLLLAIPLWLRLDRTYQEAASAEEYASNLASASTTSRNRSRKEPQLRATVHDFPQRPTPAESRIPLRMQLLGTTSDADATDAGADYELAPIDHFCYAKRRI